MGFWNALMSAWQIAHLHQFMENKITFVPLRTWRRIGRGRKHLLSHQRCQRRGALKQSWRRSCREESETESKPPAQPLSSHFFYKASRTIEWSTRVSHLLLTCSPPSFRRFGETERRAELSCKKFLLLRLGTVLSFVLRFTPRKMASFFLYYG